MPLAGAVGRPQASILNHVGTLLDSDGAACTMITCCAYLTCHRYALDALGDVDVAAVTFLSSSDSCAHINVLRYCRDSAAAQGDVTHE